MRACVRVLILGAGLIQAVGSVDVGCDPWVRGLPISLTRTTS
jgi:hypothetical protein